MRASLRWKIFMLGGLLLMPAAGIAQSTSDPAQSSTPSTDAVGPQELQNFSLPGNVTKPADQQGQPPQASSSPATTPQSTPDQAAPVTARAERKEPRRNPEIRVPTAVPASANTPTPVPSTSVGAVVGSPPASQEHAAPATAPVQPTTFPAPAPAPIEPEPAPGSEHRLLVWPWLLAALALVGSMFFLLWRRRQQSAFAGAPQLDMFTAPEPAPAPPPTAPPVARAPVPPRALEPTPAPRPKPVSAGIVSTRLRPVLEVDARPLRCLVEEDRVILEFELELFNAGTAPARAVLAEASLFNAGAQQEQELSAFFANPVGAGERLDVIPPMKRITFINQVVASREAIQEYELGGRKVFVPILAFNALYAWSAGEAQTSAAYLVGRDTAGEKLGPLSLDRGPREIGKLASRSLPTAVRT